MSALISHYLHCDAHCLSDSAFAAKWHELLWLAKQKLIPISFS